MRRTEGCACASSPSRRVWICGRTICAQPAARATRSAEFIIRFPNLRGLHARRDPCGSHSVGACASSNMALAPRRVDFSGRWKLNAADGDDPLHLLQIASRRHPRRRRTPTQAAAWRPRPGGAGYLRAHSPATPSPSLVLAEATLSRQTTRDQASERCPDFSSEGQIRVPARRCSQSASQPTDRIAMRRCRLRATPRRSAAGAKRNADRSQQPRRMKIVRRSRSTTAFRKTVSA